MLTDGQTDKKRTNEKTELHQFRKEPSYDSDLSPVKLEFNWTKRFELESGNGNIDRQTNRHKTDKRMDGITPISKGT